MTSGPRISGGTHVAAARYPALPTDTSTQAGRTWLAIGARSEARRARDGLETALRLYNCGHFGHREFRDLEDKFRATIAHWDAEVERLEGNVS